MTDTEEANRDSDITVYVRQQQTPPSRWDTLERIARIASAVAIPIVLGVFGFFIEGRLRDQAVRREYVTLAVSVLQEPDTKKAIPEMKEWAADLLNQNSPTPLSPRLLNKLKAGTSTFPSEKLLACQMGVSPGTIGPGESARLDWSSTNATSVSITPSIGLVPLFGSRDVSPIATTTYTITAINAAGDWATASVTLHVADAPRNPSNR